MYKPTHVQQVLPRKPRCLCVTAAVFEARRCSVSTPAAEVALFDLNTVKEPSIATCHRGPHICAMVTNCRLCEFTQIVLCEV